MRKNLLLSFFLLPVVSCIIFSCGKTEVLKTESLNDYMPLVVGKYITYRVDSTVFAAFGRTTEIHRYQEKDVVDAQVTDNLGRPSYRVFRYLRDSAGTQPWQPIGSFLVTQTSDHVEVIDDNQRVMKLHLPIRDGYSWKGNSFLAADPYGSIYTFSNDDNMSEWDFFYDGEMQDSASLQGKTYHDLRTVAQDDEYYEFPLGDPHPFISKSFGVEKYSKTIGMVYRDLELWEQQPNPSGTAPNITYDPYRIGFGIKMWMIDHN
jgi:hypothetical protein